MSAGWASLSDWSSRQALEPGGASGKNDTLEGTVPLEGVKIPTQIEYK